MRPCMRHVARGSWGAESSPGGACPVRRARALCRLRFLSFVWFPSPRYGRSSYGVGRSDRVRWARAAAAALRALAAARPRWPRCVSTVFHQPRAGCTARNNDKRTNAGRARKSGQRSGFRSPRASRGRVAGGAGSRAVSQIAKRGQIEHKLQRPNEPRRHPTIRICCNHS